MLFFFIRLKQAPREAHFERNKINSETVSGFSLKLENWMFWPAVYGVLMVSLIHAEFGVILSYIRGLSMPLCAHAIRHDAMPTRAQR